MKRIAALLLLVLVSGCASMSTSGAPVNTLCPFAGEPINAESPTAMVGETKIGFCCEKCAAKFENMTLAEQREVAAKFMGVSR